jgi:aryl-alcohol dehydrogenase-like predicted oxidoreductase
MRKRRLGRTDLELTTIGLGTWAIGGAGWQYAWGPQDDKDSVAAIQRALEAGINWIDTAAVYGLGHAEEVVGRAVKGRRTSVVLATKCSRVWEPGNPTIGSRLKADSIRAEIEASLRRLQTDWIDLYQIHWPRPEEDIEEGWSEIVRAVKAGTIRHAGVSNFSREQIERVLPIHPVASLQPPYSMLRREVEEELLGWCASRGIGVVAYSPMQNGLLSGTFSRERIAALPADDWRRESPHFTEPALSANLELVEGLKRIAARSGHTAGQLAIAWVLRRPEITAAIVGSRRPSQVDETLGGADWDLSPEESAQVEKLLAERRRETPHEQSKR